jgi:cell wall assembly regulator SMI1
MERDLARLVFERWKETASDGQSDRPGVHSKPATEKALERSEADHAVSLPESFHRLWRLSDGTGAMDEHELIFWPMGVIQTTLKRFAKDDPSTNARLDTPDALLAGFADYSLQAAVFYLRLDRRAGTADVWVDTYQSGDLPGRLRRVAGSFYDFLQGYLDNPLFWR